VPYSLKPPILLAIGLLLFFLSQEQTIAPGYTVVNYNSENGLPQNSINDMAFDSNGFLWLATEMGTLRFDGRNFREYNMANSPALYSNRCSLVKRVKGQLLLEPTFGSHRIVKVAANYQLQADSLLSANPYQCNRWNNCIFYYANIYKKWQHDSSAFKGLLRGLDLNGDLITENESQAYVRKDSSCYYLNDNTATVHLLPEIAGHALKIQFMVGNVFMYVDRQNRFYAYKDGRWQKDITCSARLLKIFGQAQSGAYPAQYTVTVQRDSAHTFLIYKDNMLLLHIRNGQLDFDVLAASTAIRSINCIIYNEAYHTIYIGTATNGLYILKKHAFERLYFSSDHYAINSLYAQVELPGGNILTASGILNMHTRVNIPMPGLYDRPGLLHAADGYIYYSNYNTLKKIDTGLHTPVALEYIDGWLMSVIEAANKDILYCTGNRLYRRNIQGATLLLDHPALMQGAFMQVIFAMSNSEIWIGTSTGLFSYDVARNTLRRLPGLGQAWVRVISRARDGSIWIGTYGQGFYKYDHGRFIKMPTDHNNNLSWVHCFMEDEQGYFWLPTNKGLYRVARRELDGYAAGNKATVFYYYFDKSAGFSTNEFNGGCTPCGIVTRDGRFSLPSLDGLVQFKPADVTIELPIHPVFIDRVIPEEKRVLPGDRFEQRQDAGPLTFTIASPYFGNRANLHLEYSIPQLDKNWHMVSDDGKLVLTGLQKGRYSLIIRKLESYGRYTYKTVQWTILPYWYETIWFGLLVAIVVIGMLSFVFWLRYARQVKRAALLEQKVAERTEALLASNQVKEKMIAIILHDLRSPLRFLHILANHIYDNYQKASRSELQEMLFRFRNATHDLNDFTQDFLTWTNAQKEGFVIRRETIVLREIVGGIISLYEPAAAIRNNKVHNRVPAAITLTTDPNILKLIIRNLADNANKYTLNGEISMDAVQQGDTVRITITDTGDSMTKELVADIIANTYQSENEDHGFGYRIIMDLLVRIQGQLTIDHPGGTGNRITLTFQC
jgi:signal transduction histidine kinase